MCVYDERLVPNYLFFYDEEDFFYFTLCLMHEEKCISCEPLTPCTELTKNDFLKSPFSLFAAVYESVYECYACTVFSQWKWKRWTRHIEERKAKEDEAERCESEARVNGRRYEFKERREREVYTWRDLCERGRKQHTHSKEEKTHTFSIDSVSLGRQDCTIKKEKTECYADWPLRFELKHTYTHCKLWKECVSVWCFGQTSHRLNELAETTERTRSQASQHSLAVCVCEWMYVLDYGTNQYALCTYMHKWT